MQDKKGTTRYGTIAALIKERISSGEWQPGSSLPAEIGLAKQYEVALGTIRQAIDILVAEKLLVKHHGRGTFVSAGLGNSTTWQFFKFSQTEMPPVTLVKSCGIVDAGDACKALFGADCEQVIHVERVRMFGSVPRVHEQIWLPLPMFRSILELDESCWEQRLYPLYARQCAVTVVAADDDISVEPMEAQAAAHLKLSEGSPGVSIKRKSIDILGRVAEYRVAVGDAYQFRFSGKVA